MSEHKKLITIIVEATPHQWAKEKITYAEVVALEVSNYPQNPPVKYSVTYSKGQGNKQGTLVLGSSVAVKEGMIFNVSPTGAS